MADDRDLIDRAIAFYERSPDGQYDVNVVAWLGELKQLREQLRDLVARTAVPASDATGSASPCAHERTHVEADGEGAADRLLVCSDCDIAMRLPVGARFDVGATAPADDATGEASRYDGHCRNCGASTKIDTGSHCPACYPPRASVPANAARGTYLCPACDGADPGCRNCGGTGRLAHQPGGGQ